MGYYILVYDIFLRGSTSNATILKATLVREVLLWAKVCLSMLEIGINILSIYAQEDFLQYQFSIYALGINISNGKKKIWQDKEHSVCNRLVIQE